jgi:hypothetical protein
MSTMLADSAHISNGTINKVKTTSYDINCEAERSAPNKAYFELLDHPEKIIP